MAADLKSIAPPLQQLQQQQPSPTIIDTTHHQDDSHKHALVSSLTDVLEDACPHDAAAAVLISTSTLEENPLEEEPPDLATMMIHPTSNNNNNNKRSHMELIMGDYGEDTEEQKRQKLKMAAGAAAAKKVNNEQWDAMFERLVAYKAQHGDCLVPKRYAADPKLGTWVETQRVQYKRLERTPDESGTEAVQPNKRLNQERLHKLESIGFAWTAKGRKTKPGGEELDPTAPSLTATSSNPKPPPKKSPTEEGRAARNRFNDSQWEEMYLRLARYKENFGNTLVPRKYEQDPKLATWVETQRVLWNRDYHKPTPAETAAYKSEEAAWAESLVVDKDQGVAVVGGATAEDAAELAASMVEDMNEVIAGGQEESQDYKNHQHATGQEQEHAAAVVEAAAAAAAEAVDMPLLDEANRVKLLLAAPNQPKRLTQERKDKLDAIGFVWSLRNKRIDDHWDEMFKQLIQYKQSHGDCLVPSRYEENLKLGKWVETQRYEYTKLQRFTTESEQESSKPRATNPRLTEERLRRLEAIGFEWKVKHKMKRYYDKQWDQMFDRLLKYKETNGHCMVPKRFPPDMKLGTWVHTQRIQYRKMVAGAGGSKPWDPETDSGMDYEIPKGEDEVTFRLTDDRRKRLEQIGFIWSARESEKVESGRITRNSYDDQWDAMFNRLKGYKDKHGDCLVPKRCKEDPKLGTWVDTQRVQYKKMKKKLASQGVDYDGPNSANEGEESDSNTPKPLVGRLTDDRIRRLEALGFVWSLRDDWQKHYDELKAYKKEHGHCNVPARHAKNRRLGIWVSAQRQQFKIMQIPEDAKNRRSAPLTQERINKLNEIGFTWTIRSRDSLGESWNQRLQDLREYKAQFGNCLVPSRYPPNPELGVWVGTQRTQYRLFMRAQEEGRPVSGASAMNEERIQQLEDIGFVWALRGGEGKKDLNDSIDGGSIEEEAMQVVEEVTGTLGTLAAAERVHAGFTHSEII